MDETIKMNVKALAANMNLSIEKLAELAGINVNHLLQVSCGRVKMTADEYSTPPEPLCPVLRATHSVERAIFLFR